MENTSSYTQSLHKIEQSCMQEFMNLDQKLSSIQKETETSMQQLREKWGRPKEPSKQGLINLGKSSLDLQSRFKSVYSNIVSKNQGRNESTSYHQVNLINSELDKLNTSYSALLKGWIVKKRLGYNQECPDIEAKFSIINDGSQCYLGRKLHLLNSDNGMYPNLNELVDNLAKELDKAEKLAKEMDKADKLAKVKI